jgi:hypothetical protein
MNTDDHLLAERLAALEQRCARAERRLRALGGLGLLAWRRRRAA